MRSRWKRAAALVVDAALSAVAPLLVRRTASRVVPSAPRVLVIRCDHIGDAAMATTVLDPLRAALAPSTLDVLASPWNAPVFAGHRCIDRVLRVATPWWSITRGASRWTRMCQWAQLPGVIREIRAARYDVGIDLRGDLRHATFFLALGGIPVRVGSDRTGGARLLTHVWSFDARAHEVEKNVAVAALLVPIHAPRLDIAAGDTVPPWIERELASAGFGDGYVVFALRGSEPWRSWPPEPGRAVAMMLWHQLGLASVYVGSASDAEHGAVFARDATVGIVNLAGRTNVDELIGVLRGARAVVAVDSGPMHLAAGVGTPVVALFGPSDPAIFGPWATHTRVLGSGAPCGCTGARCAFEIGAGTCMQRITPGQVFDAVHALVSPRAGAHT